MKKNNHETLISLGILPFLAATTRLYYAFWLALAFVVITILTALTASLTRTVIKGKAGLIADTAVCAGLTTAAVLILRAAVPTAAAGMGICLSLAAVNWLVSAVCKASAENNIKASVENAAFSSLAGAGLLIVSAAVREIITTGSLFAGFGGNEGVLIFGEWFRSLNFAGTSAGALIIFAFAAACLQKITKTVRNSGREKRIQRDTINSGNHPDLVLDAETGKIVRRSTEEMLMKRRADLAASAENDADTIKAFDENEIAALEGTETDAENKNGEAEE